jgi:hypothetical protein
MSTARVPSTVKRTVSLSPSAKRRVNRHVQIGDGGEVPRPALLLRSFQPRPLPGHGSMVQVVRRDKLVGPIHSLLVEDLLKEASHEHFVVFG